MKKNEANACDSFIQILKEINGVDYCPVRWPENENRNSPDVEVIIAPKDGCEQIPQIAVEHTIVEAHEKQIAYVNQSYDIVAEVNQRCQGQLPADRCFQLVIPPPLITGTSKKSRSELVEKVSIWITSIAKNLSNDQWSSQIYGNDKISFKCFGSVPEMNGRIGRMPTRPTDPEKEKRNRFRRSIKDKLPKLIKYKEDEYETALLLEDISFSHSSLISNWKDLVPRQYHLDFQSKIDYVVIFVSNHEEMIVGNVWKEKSQLYSIIPDDKKFSFRR